jgi:hypothetical protein
MRPVKCILEPIPTIGEKLARAIVVLLVLVYVGTASFYGFGKIMDIISDHQAKAEMTKKIKNGDFVAPKKGRKG